MAGWNIHQLDQFFNLDDPARQARRNGLRGLQRLVNPAKVIDKMSLMERTPLDYAKPRSEIPHNPHPLLFWTVIGALIASILAAAIIPIVAWLFFRLYGADI